MKLPWENRPILLRRDGTQLALSGFSDTSARLSAAGPKRTCAAAAPRLASGAFDPFQPSIRWRAAPDRIRRA
jgi:hypothetical protein